MKQVRTPCIGICSTTSLGDPICRGCKRYAHEVIQWNSYGDQEKLAVLRRVEKLNTQILENRLWIFSVTSLREGLRALKVPYDESLSPYCWLHNLLKRQHHKLESLAEFGVAVRDDYQHLDLPQLLEQIEREIMLLCEAHSDRYQLDPAQSATRHPETG